MPEVNPEAIVVRSEGYGITMAAGALARFPDDPPVALLMDLEGPATRDQSSYVYGGPVPVDPHDAAFWSGHEDKTVLNLLYFFLVTHTTNPNL